MKKFNILIITTLFFLTACRKENLQFESKWTTSVEREWIGPDFWANPLQDWHISNGRLECQVTGPNRSVHLLTFALHNIPGSFETDVDLGIINSALLQVKQQGWAGFLIGAKGRFNDYRDDAVFGQGLHAGINTKGHLFIGSPDGTGTTSDQPALIDMSDTKGVTLHLQIENNGTDKSKITLSAATSGKKHSVHSIEKEIPSSSLEGNIALKADFEGKMNNPDRNPSVWFANWTASGTCLKNYPERSFGPILFTQYTLSKNIVKLTAQMPPIASSDSKTATLEFKNNEGKWEQVASAAIDPMAMTATFRLEAPDKSDDIPYRIVYNWSADKKPAVPFYYDGTIRHDPIEKEEIVVAAFTGNNDIGFPNNEIVQNVLKHKPDFLVFTGDQIYEPRGGFGIIIEPVELATLDYLRKWYMFGWEYSEMLRNIPSVALPDDHDVYHGNLWGCGGKAAQKTEDVKAWQDDGGYKLPPEWVNVVQRTQTSHLPDPYDPTPALQDISVYYCEMNLGGISFAIIEDRKWKSAPKALLPARLKVVNGWAENSRINDPRVYDVDASLLGDRQMKFLDKWVGDWSNRTIMKSVISQTIFNTIATLPDSAVSDVVVSKLRITNPGEYPDNDIPTQDMDSNGWPRKARDKALRTIRKGFVFHISGDQHLASTVHYGIDEWGDAGYAICVPSISNYFPRRWFPEQGGENRKPGLEKNLGDFTDGFGNKMTVMAVANPVVTGLKPAILYDRSSGYGIIRFNKKTREINIANWPRKSDPDSPDGKPYPGWPIVIDQEDNYGRTAVAWLPDLEFSGTELPPVVRIINEKNGELVYAVRAKEFFYKPKVFDIGSYTIEAGEPGTAKWKVLSGIASRSHPGKNKIKIAF